MKEEVWKEKFRSRGFSAGGSIQDGGGERDYWKMENGVGNGNGDGDDMGLEAYATPLAVFGFNYFAVFLLRNNNFGREKKGTKFLPSLKPNAKRS